MFVKCVRERVVSASLTAFVITRVIDFFTNCEVIKPANLKCHGLQWSKSKSRHRLPCSIETKGPKQSNSLTSLTADFGRRSIPKNPHWGSQSFCINSMDHLWLFIGAIGLLGFFIPEISTHKEFHSNCYWVQVDIIYMPTYFISDIEMCLD